MTDEFPSTPSTDGVTRPTAEAIENLKTQVKSSTERLVGESKRAFADAKVAAVERVGQGRTLIEDRPYQAVGLALLAGVVFGHLLTAGRPQVVYLKDRRFD
jgi:ElaB/YqjD/DUF883 family membrane-anchored ribosome-binding protein